jgi:two-component system response regulator YesN
MYKMLLVEDEPATINGIKTAVNWKLLDITICGEASNGLEAYPLIKELKPDIILCDIRMPKMDGITLISEIQPRHPEIKVIFISGYSDKEYLKKAIKLNVIDYLYKPIELSELVQAVEKAKDACAKHTTAGNIPDNNLALNLIQEGWHPGPIPREIPVDLDDTLITVIVKFNMSLDSALETDTIALSRYQPEFQRVFSEVFRTHYIVSPVNNGFILHANVPSDFLQQKETVHQLDRLFRISGEAARYLTVGIGDPVESSACLKESFRQARKAVHSAFLIGYGKLICYRDLNKTPFYPSADLENQFFHQINVNNMASAIDFLEDYITYMSCCRPEDIPAIKDELASISFRLNQKLKKQESMQQSFVTETINYALEITDIKKYLMHLLEQILSEINNLENKGRIIFDVERYILENYDKGLAIKKIADHVFITPTYLCHLYKLKTGRTINQFILDVKMNKSKKLITETNMKLSEISEKLGYSNQNYFTRTFTKYFGVTPSTFRNKRL